MKTIEVTEATAPLGEYAKNIDGEPVILTVKGKPVAALVPIESTDLESVTLSTDPEFLTLIERSRIRQKSEGGISSAEMRLRLGLKRPA